MNPCPVCENKAHLTAMDMTPELAAEMAAEEKVADYAGDALVAERLKICNSCPKLMAE